RESLFHHSKLLAGRRADIVVARAGERCETGRGGERGPVGGSYVGAVVAWGWGAPGDGGRWCAAVVPGKRSPRLGVVQTPHGQILNMAPPPWVTQSALSLQSAGSLRGGYTPRSVGFVVLVRRT